MLKFKTTDGGETWAATPSYALFYWWARTLPNRGMPETPEVAGVILLKMGKPQPSAYHPVFLRRVVWAIERNYGKTFDIDPALLTEAWYETLPAGVSDHETVMRLHDEGNPQVSYYEATCMGILNWLHQHGDIKEITVEK